jgi:hypothetical protein
VWKLSNEPSSINNIVKDALVLYKLTFFRLLPFVLIYAVFSIIAGAYGGQVILFDSLSLPLTMVVNWPALLTTFFSQLLGLWVFIVLLSLTVRMVLEDRWDYQTAIVEGTKKFPLCFITGVAFALLSMIGFLLLVFPGIFLYVLFAFVFLNILVDSDSFWGSFVHSAKLVLPEWWRTFAVFLEIMLFLVGFYLILRYAIEQPITRIWLNEYPAIALWGEAISQGIMSLVTLPLVVLILVRQYFDLKLRYQERSRMQLPE